jgi:predicted MFS family arabinose efflux permease
MTGAEDRRHAPSSPFVWAFAISQMAGWGVLYFSFTLLVGPMEIELGWSKTDLNGALTVGLLTTAAASLPVGYWIDRYGGHLLMTLGAILAAGLLVAWSTVETLPAFYLLWIGLGLATAMTMGEPVFAVLTVNVREYRRAITYVAFVTGLSSTAFIPLMNLLIGWYGWRTALVILGFIYLAIAGGLNAIFLKGTRGTGRIGAKEAVADAGPSPLRMALRRRAFWGLVVCFSVQTFTFSGITYHIIPMLQEKGQPLDAIVAMLALIGPAQVSGRLVLHFFGERVSMRTLGSAAAPVLPLVLLLLLVGPSFGFAGLVAYALLSGITNGLLIIVRIVGLAEILGTRGYGQISGALMAIIMLPRTAAPLAMAAMWQAFGGYDTVLLIMIAAAAVGAAGFWVAAADRPMEG